LNKKSPLNRGFFVFLKQQKKDTEVSFGSGGGTRIKE